MPQTTTQPQKADGKPLLSFHFDCGNSSTGPIGFCARVKAHSREEALAVLRKALPEDLMVLKNDGAIEYLQVYFNDQAVTVENSNSDLDEDAA